MSLILLSLIAGILTVLAPCAFMLLPIIIGGSVGNHNRWRPYIITASLGVSLFLFTILLKVTSLLININPVYLSYFSGVVILILGFISLFPEAWDKVSLYFNLSGNSDKLLEKAQEKQGVLGAILTGAALGPVFSSCSPTYVFILTTVLRENLITGLVNILAYIFGLSAVMLAVGLLGQKFIKKARWAVNPKGLFKRIIAVVFILVGISIIFGFDKQLQANFASFSPVTRIEESLLNQTTNSGNMNLSDDSTELFNVNPATKAPEITGISQWINSDAQTLEKLKGKVVLIDFWTYSCVNCLRSAPYLNKWHETYQADGLVILGLHAPEFAFEKNKVNVEKAVKDTYNIKYPVGLDNDLATWDAYNNQYWPAKYLIDKEGNLRYTHFGEGSYDKTEQAIRALLEEKGSKIDGKTVSNEVNSTGQVRSDQTPETYLGFSRNENFANNSELNAQQGFNKTVAFTKPATLESSFWSLQGNWTVKNELIVSESDGNILELNFSAKEVYLVMGADTPTEIQVQTNAPGDDVTQGVVTVSDYKLYKLVKLNSFETNQTIKLIVPKGVTMNAFTFGS